MLSFGITELTPLILAFLFAILSCFLFAKNKRGTTIALFLTGAATAFFMANLDPFLALWDEQYHALVAKNMTDSPLHPKLYREAFLSHEYLNWTNCTTWLHKPPIFLWQISASIKVFGPTAFAVRFPDILMHGLLSVLIYRIGTNLSVARIGLIAAIIFAFAFYPLELITGRFPTDHNDVAFLFYVTASFWAWTEFQKRANYKWLIAIGIFVAAAVLTKWMVGFILFPVWTLSLMLNEPKQIFKLKRYLPILLSFGIALILVLPWYLYIHLTFPNEAALESVRSAEHFTNVIEDHGGGWYFHFREGIDIMYGKGDLIPFLILGGIVAFIFQLKTRLCRLVVGISVVSVYLFFTIAATKMIGFTLIVAPFVYLGYASIIHLLISFFEQRSWSKVCLLSLYVLPFLISVVALNFGEIRKYHTLEQPRFNANRGNKLAEMKMIGHLKVHLKEGSVIFNARQTMHGQIPIMFFTDFIAYERIPSEIQLKKLKEDN